MTGDSEGSPCCHLRPPPYLFLANSVQNVTHPVQNVTHGTIHHPFTVILKGPLTEQIGVLMSDVNIDKWQCRMYLSPKILFVSCRMSMSHVNIFWGTMPRSLRPMSACRI